MKTGATQFNNLQLYIGIDVPKKQWSLSIFTDAAHHRTFSQPPSPSALKAYIDQHSQDHLYVVLKKLQNLGIGSAAHLHNSDIDVW